MDNLLLEDIVDCLSCFVLEAVVQNFSGQPVEYELAGKEQDKHGYVFGEVEVDQFVDIVVFKDPEEGY